MQPKLKPILQKFQDYINKSNKGGLKAVEEMLKNPSTLEEALAEQDKLRQERLKMRYK